MGITTDSCIRGARQPRVRDREPRQPRAHQRHHQRLPRRPGPGHRRRLRRGDQQLRRRRQRAAGRRRLLHVLHGAPGAAAAARDHGGLGAGPRAARCSTRPALQCATCHRDDADIFVSTSAGGVPSGIRFHPFSDFLVHDMGTLGDMHRQRRATPWRSRAACGPRRCGACARATRSCTTAARPTSRTAIRRTTAARTARARPPAKAFNALSTAQKSDLIAFLNTL